MSRRLLGYVVKLPSGEWHDGKSYADKDFDGYPWTRDAKKRHVFMEYQDACRYVLTYVPENLLRIVPVFSKPKPAELKPAPAVAAEGRYAVLRKTWGGNGFCDLHYGDDTRTTLHVGTRAAVDEAQRKSGRTKSDAEVVRILPDGAHEAAIAAAREEGRREGAEAALHDARRALLDLADDFTGDHAAGLRHSVRCIYDKIQAAKEAAKGAAK